MAGWKMKKELRLQTEVVVELVSRVIDVLDKSRSLKGNRSLLAARATGKILDELLDERRLVISTGKMVALAPPPSLQDTGEPSQSAAPPKPRIIMKAEDSVTDDLIYCLFDGVGRKMITRHILAKYHMTWAQYLEYCSLPPDYPRVAPKYSDEQSRSMVKILNPDQTEMGARMKRERAKKVKRNRIEKRPNDGLVAPRSKSRPSKVPTGAPEVREERAASR